MGEVIFVDTSVLLNVMAVPKCGSREQQQTDQKELQSLTQAGAVLILPVTCLIEAGNAVANVSGPDQHHVQQKYLKFVLATVKGTAPWALSGVALDHNMLVTVMSGTSDVPPLAELLPSGVGTGDAAIVHEARQYRSRVSVPSDTLVRIWTHDRALNAWNG